MKNVIFGKKYINNQLLLDRFPGAISAYSLRLLTESYTGPCLTVRRSAGGTTANIGFVDGYLDVATMVAFASGSQNLLVDVWYDQSGNGRHMAQTNTTPKPWIINATNLVTIGSKVALECRPSALFNDSFPSSATQPISTFDVLKPDSDIVGWVWGFNSNTRAFGKYTGGYRLQFGETFNAAQTNNLKHDCIFSLVNSTSSKIKTSEGLQSGNAGINGFVTNRKGLLSFGASQTNAFVGRFQEHIQYNSDMSAVADQIINNQKIYYSVS